MVDAPPPPPSTAGEVRPPVLFLVGMILTVVAVLVTLLVLVQVGAQSRKNQQHVDCIVSLFTRTDPPRCRPVRRQLERDGIIPVRP